MARKIKLADAEWDKPALWITCPYCEYEDNYFDQWYDKRCTANKAPFPLCQSVEKEDLKDIEFECLGCEKDFGLETVTW